MRGGPAGREAHLIEIQVKAAPSGAQSVERAIAVIRALAEGGGAGVRLTDLVAKLGLNKATVRRLLMVLAREGLVVQDPGSRLYALGFEMFALGMAAGRRFDIKQLCDDSVRRLAEDSGDTCYLSVRSGLQSVCLARETGAYPIKALTLSVGDRQPLGVGAGSLAMLAALPRAEVDAIVAGSAARLLQYLGRDGGQDWILGLERDARERGYSFNDGGNVPGMKAIGVAIRNARGEPEAALSIAAVDSRMEPDRIPQLLAMLQRERALIETELRGRGR